MNNREWLNTLSDEEYADAIWEIKNLDYGCMIAYLQAEHTTTADEDFAEIGFNGMGEKVDWQKEKYFLYKDDKGRMLYVNEKSGNEYDWSSDNEAWTDELIDQIRTIADKKRKEMKWKMEVQE